MNVTESSAPETSFDTCIAAMRGSRAASGAAASSDLRFGMTTVKPVGCEAPWMRSMRGERDSTRKRGVLDTVMIVSVGLALVGFGVWFFGFAGSSLPS